ncbi:MAG: OmpA family protein [Phyllobacteriaceae bacterium]|nr:OmpA family protein [Phyllobacteriaceae bacterium]
MRQWATITGWALGLSLLVSMAFAQEPPPLDDLLTLARGAVLVDASIDARAALALTDGDPASNWNTSTAKNPAPYTFTFELVAPAVIEAVGIHGVGERPGGVVGGSAGPVTVEGSAEGPDSGFAPMAAFTAGPDGATMAESTIDTPVRWLRFSVGGPIGADAAWVYVAEAIAHGTVTPPDEDDRFTGIFQSGRADFIELRQDGTSVTGCYVENSGLSNGSLSGAVEDGVARLNWTSEQGITGTALVTIDSTGALAGVRYRQRSRSIWNGPPAPEGTTTPCSATEPTNPIITALEETGEARIYGIHFDHDSDVPKPSATSALEQLAEALESAPELNVVIEGHTDADGEDGYNLDLSDRRARSVVAWLAERGIDSGRLTPQGLGEAEPVASNDTADGKALNRRVDVVAR